MSATAPGRQLHFWFDCETTGLDPDSDTVLEVAWCFTDDNLRMISPLRQRYTRLVAPPSSPSVRFSGPFDPTDEEEWHTPERIRPFVREMHETSGLRAAWDDAQVTHPHAILTHPRDFHRLVAEDMDRINLGPLDKMSLAGAGISHFDNGILNRVFDGFYPLQPIPESSPWHYRPFDTSVAVWVGNARAAIDEVARVLANPNAESPLPFDLVECEEFVDVEVSHVVTWKRGLGEFRREDLRQHRAADDVVWSLLDARALRYLVTRR